MTMPLPVRSVPRIDAVNASSGTSTRSATTALSAVVRSNETSLLFGCSSEGNAQCVDSATSLIFQDRATSPASGHLTRTAHAGRHLGIVAGTTFPVELPGLNRPVPPMRIAPLVTCLLV